MYLQYVNCTFSLESLYFKYTIGVVNPTDYAGNKASLLKQFQCNTV